MLYYSLKGGHKCIKVYLYNMIVDEVIELKVNGSQLKHFSSIGVDVKSGDVIKIKPNQLNNGSNIKVNCKCDVCGKEKYLPYRRYLKSVNNGGYYSCSVKCSQNKVKNTFLKKYGVEHHFQSKSTKDKIKETLLEHYGTEHFSHSVDYKNKVQSIVSKRKLTVESEYIKNTDNISVSGDTFYRYCDDHDGYYFIDKKLYHNRMTHQVNLCTTCYPLGKNVSIKELEVGFFIKSHYKGEIIYNHKVDNKEIDIYLPELGLGIEFNGLYWHCELHRPNDYHLNKTKLCESNNIQLIHIYEDEWSNKREIVESRLLNMLGGSIRVYARKCVIQLITPKEYRDFCDKNHTQGSINSLVKVGLYYNNELTSVMGLGKLRKSLGSSHIDDVYELHRFCNKLGTTVVGGSSRLFRFFIKTYNPITIISYADRSWSIGNMYEQLGFNLLSETKPNYHYIINKKRMNRYGFRKDVLVKEGYNKDLTERFIMLSRGINRIYDSGSLKYIYNKKPL